MRSGCVRGPAPDGWVTWLEIRCSDNDWGDTRPGRPDRWWPALPSWLGLSTQHFTSHLQLSSSHYLESPGLLISMEEKSVAGHKEAITIEINIKSKYNAGMRVVTLVTMAGPGLVILHYNALHNCLSPYMEHNGEARQRQSLHWWHIHTANHRLWPRHWLVSLLSQLVISSPRFWIPNLAD